MQANRVSRYSEQKDNKLHFLQRNLNVSLKKTFKNTKQNIYQAVCHRSLQLYPMA